MGVRFYRERVGGIQIWDLDKNFLWNFFLEPVVRELRAVEDPPMKLLGG